MMRICALAIVTVFVSLLSFAPAFAVNPDERLADPALEERAREISKELRCLQCQNQSIDDSDAGYAKDMRLLVRERLQAGDSDQAVLDYVVDRYGEFALLRPKFSWQNFALWFGPAFVFAVAALLILARTLTSKQRHTPVTERLSNTELDEINRILEQRKQD